LDVAFTVKEWAYCQWYARYISPDTRVYPGLNHVVSSTPSSYQMLKDTQKEM